jgi:FkbM family methyltransferase
MELSDSEKIHIFYLQLGISHLWANSLPCDFVDVGSNYGTVSMRIADFMRQCERHGLVYAFEPGLTFPLLESNIIINRLSNYILPEKTAVGREDTVTAMTFQAGFSGSGMIHLFEKYDIPCFYRLMPICRLDTYFSTKTINNLIIKIDVEGFDADVIFGLEGIIDKVNIIAFEYTLHVMRGTGVNPVDALLFLNKNGFELFNCYYFLESSERTPVADLELINPEDNDAMESFFDKVTKFPNEQTDILAVKDTLPQFNEYIAKLKKWTGKMEANDGYTQ